MIKMVWQCISPEVTVRDFRKCCVSSERDGTDDDILWNDGDEVGDVRKMKTLTV
jgi:hypothetical protein